MTIDQNDFERLERNRTDDAKPFSGRYCEEKIEQKKQLVVHKRTHKSESVQYVTIDACQVPI